MITLIIGAILLIRLFYINEGISVSVLSRKTPSIKALSHVIQLNPHHGYAHNQIAWIEFQRANYEVAKIHAYKALNNNLSDGLAMTMLMSIFDYEKNAEMANQAAQLSAQLWPAHDISMRLIAHHWIQEKNIAKAMSAWNVILNQDPFDEEQFFNGWAAKNLFPILNTIAQVDASKQLFQPYHAMPPSWWNMFFQYISKLPNNIKAVDRFYQQMETNNKVSDKNRKIFLGNLVTENQWPKAHAIWTDGLSDGHKPYTQLIYDGGFETNLLNEYFSWIAAPKTHVNVYTDRYSKFEGNNSLHIEFTSQVDDYWGWVRQILVLKPGKYHIEFQTRARLKSHKGLKWRIGCLKNTKEKIKTLADSSPITGNFEWKKQEFTFRVPKSKTCKAQNLHLIPAGNNALENRMRGDIWFDDFKITRLK